MLWAVQFLQYSSLCRVTFFQSKMALASFVVLFHSATYIILSLASALRSTFQTTLNIFTLDIVIFRRFRNVLDFNSSSTCFPSHHTLDVAQSRGDGDPRIWFAGHMSQYTPMRNGAYRLFYA